MFQEIYVIDEQEELTEELKKMFKEEPNYRFKKNTYKRYGLCI